MADRCRRDPAAYRIVVPTDDTTKEQAAAEGDLRLLTLMMCRPEGSR